MPLPLTVSCFSKIQIGFAFLVLAHLGSCGQNPEGHKMILVVVVLLECIGFTWHLLKFVGWLSLLVMARTKQYFLLSGILHCSCRFGLWAISLINLFILLEWNQPLCRAYSLTDVCVCVVTSIVSVSTHIFLLPTCRSGHTARHSVAVWMTWWTLTGWERLITTSCKFSSLGRRSTSTSTTFDRTPTTPVSRRHHKAIIDSRFCRRYLLIFFIIIEQNLVAIDAIMLLLLRTWCTTEPIVWLSALDLNPSSGLSSDVSHQ